MDNEVFDRAQEHLTTACHQLQEFLDQKPSEDELAWAAELGRLTRALQEAFIEHKDLAEQPEGPIQEILETKPALSPDVEEQAAEHDELAMRIDTLATDAQRVQEFEQANVELLHIEGRITELMVRRHMMRESMLFYEAFFRVEGGQEG